MKLEKTDRINSNRINAIQKVILKLLDREKTDVQKYNAIESLAYSLADKNGRYLGKTEDGEKVFENCPSPSFIEPLQQKIQLASSNLEGDLGLALQFAIEKRVELCNIRAMLERSHARANKIDNLKICISQERAKLEDEMDNTEREKIHSMIEKLEMELSNI